MMGMTSQISDPSNGSVLPPGTIQSSRTPVSYQHLSSTHSPIKERQKSISKRQSRNASKRRGSDNKTGQVPVSRAAVLSSSGNRQVVDSYAKNDNATVGNVYANMDKTKTTSGGPKVSVR